MAKGNGGGKPVSTPAGRETATRASAPRPAEVLGEIAGLMMQSPGHRHLFLADFEWLVVPPVMTQQFVIYRKQKTPVAYASWALVNEGVEKRLTSGERRLAPGEWRSGDRLWLIDLVAPFGGAEKVIADLRGRVFKGREVKTLRPGPGGAPVVETWPAAAETAGWANATSDPSRIAASSVVVGEMQSKN